MGRLISKGDSMNIIVGLAGEGTRFKNEGYELPKFLIAYHGAPMIYHAVETIGLEGKIHFVVKEEHLQKYRFLEKMLLGLGSEIIPIKQQTSGAAESLLLAKPYIQDHTDSLLSVNCDQYLSWKSYKFQQELTLNPDTSYIVTYKENSDKCSYVREENDYVVEVREKKVISNDATIGYYHWASTNDFFIDAEQMIADEHKENNEYYVAPVYNYSIARGLKVKKYSIKNEEFWPVGTPDDYKQFEDLNSEFD
jgi:NDP-sugar pyrophosphorylase family protein